MKKNKRLTSNLITYGVLIAMFLFALFMVESGQATRHFKSLLVPICINIILAVSLNLTVGFLGELTLGHAGVM